MTTPPFFLRMFSITALFAVALGRASAAADPIPAPPAAPHVNAAIVPATREGGFMDFHKQYVALIKQGKIDVVFTGDSITFQWRNVGKTVWDKYYGAMQAANFGHSGDGTQHLLWRLQNGECDGPAPKVVVLMIGTNNMGGNTYSVTDVAEGVTANVNELRKDWPTAKILLMGITPSGGSLPEKRKKLDDVNRVIAKLDDGKHVFFMDIGPKFMDEKGFVPPSLIAGLHPTAAGYEVWAAAMKDPLDNLLAGKAPDGQPLPQ